MKTAFFLLAATTSLTFGSVVIPKEVSGPRLPKIWAQASSQERLKAIRAAEVDGDRQLVENMSGIQIDSSTTVRDLLSENDISFGEVSGVLTGSKTAGDPKFFEDGRVQVIREVELEQLVQLLKRVVQQKKNKDGSVSVLSDAVTPITRVEQYKLEFVGNSALPGTEGHEKILSKRAAEIDCYRRLAERVKGIKLDGDSTIESSCLNNDNLRTELSHLIKNAVVRSIEYDKEDNSCAVTMELSVTDIIAKTKQYRAFNKTKTVTKDELKQTKIIETGKGAARERQVTLDSRFSYEEN
jgi:hypothetical protein